MKLIRTIFDQGLPPDILFGSLGATSSQEKQEKIKKLLFFVKNTLKANSYRFKTSYIKNQ